MDHPLNLNQQHDQHIQELLESLRKTSKNLQNKYYIAYKTNFNETIIKSLLDLELESISLIANDPYLLNLSKLLTNLKTQLEAHQALFGRSSYDILSIVKRQVKNYEISDTACSIEKEIQIWFDRRLVQDVATTLDECRLDDDEKLTKVLIEFKKRVSVDNFDSDLQDLILKAGIFTLLETVVSDSQNSTRLREQCGTVISSLVQFNKDVFVGLVLMGQIYRNLVTMATCESIQVLTCLVKLIKSPLIDELESNGEIRKIVALLDQANDEEIGISTTFRALVMDCLLEITYFGRQDVIEAILREGIVEKLMGLQRETSAMQSPEAALERCAVKFAVQVEVGEGMNGKERREVKLEILKRVRESSVSDLEGANVVAEVLWGSSPMNF